MKIYCEKCRLYLGEIKEGSKLRKNIVHLCEKCNTQREALELRYKEGEASYRDIINDFWGKYQ